MDLLSLNFSSSFSKLLTLHTSSISCGNKFQKFTICYVKKVHFNSKDISLFQLEHLSYRIEVLHLPYLPPSCFQLSSALSLLSAFSCLNWSHSLFNSEVTFPWSFPCPSLDLLYLCHTSVEVENPEFCLPLRMGLHLRVCTFTRTEIWTPGNLQNVRQE